MSATSTNRFTCKYCDKVYIHSPSLSRHVRQLHGVQSPAVSVLSALCQEEGCGAAFVKLEELRDHLNGVHSFGLVDETEEFPSMDDFQQWKEEMEQKEQARFIKKNGADTRADCTVFYYYCNRSGNYQSVSTGKRKVGASCKTGQICTSYITAKRNNSSGKVFVKFCRSHYFHEKELRHLHSTSAERSRNRERIVRRAVVDFQQKLLDISNKVSTFSTVDDLQLLSEMSKLATTMENLISTHEKRASTTNKNIE